MTWSKFCDRIKILNSKGGDSMKNLTPCQLRYKKVKEIMKLLNLKDTPRERYIAKFIAIKIYGFPYIYKNVEEFNTILSNYKESNYLEDSSNSKHILNNHFNWKKISQLHLNIYLNA